MTVTPKRKQKENPTSNVTPTGNLQKEFPTIEETIVKRQQSDEDLPKLEENAVEEEAPVQSKFEFSFFFSLSFPWKNPNFWGFTNKKTHVSRLKKPSFLMFQKIKT